MGQLDLWGNDGQPEVISEEVRAEKRENFKKAVLAAIEETQVWNSNVEYMIAENIVKKTFDRGVVN